MGELPAWVLDAATTEAPNGVELTLARLRHEIAGLGLSDSVPFYDEDGTVGFPIVSHRRNAAECGGPLAALFAVLKNEAEEQASRDEERQRSHDLAQQAEVRDEATRKHDEWIAERFGRLPAFPEPPTPRVKKPEE